MIPPPPPFPTHPFRVHGDRERESHGRKKIPHPRLFLGEEGEISHELWKRETSICHWFLVRRDLEPAETPRDTPRKQQTRDFVVENSRFFCCFWFFFFFSREQLIEREIVFRLRAMRVQIAGIFWRNVEKEILVGNGGRFAPGCRFAKHLFPGINETVFFFLNTI